MKLPTRESLTDADLWLLAMVKSIACTGANAEVKKIKEESFVVYGVNKRKHMYKAE